MGIFSMKGYNKPGKGVDKLEQRSEGGVLFFEIFFRKFWKFVQVNLLFCVANIPTFLIMLLMSGIVSNAIFETFSNDIASMVGIAAPDFSNPDFSAIYISIDVIIRLFVTILFTIFWGMGPATAGMHYILRNYSREENAFILSDFWDAIKDNYKQSLVIFLIDVLAFFVFFYGITFYGSQTSFMKYAKYLVYCLFLFYTMVHLFLYPLMVRYKLSIGKLFKNSALFCLASLPFSFLVIVILSALTIGVGYICIFVIAGTAIPVFATIYVLLTLLILYSLCGFIVSYNAECQISKHIDENAQIEEKADFEKKEKSINNRTLY